jgi:hypothetical protein
MEANSEQSRAGRAGAAQSIHDEARGSARGISFKGELRASRLDEEVLLAFGKHFKHGPAHALLSEKLYEEAATIASDFENAIRQLIASRVVFVLSKWNTLA